MFVIYIFISFSKDNQRMINYIIKFYKEDTQFTTKLI